MDPGDQLPMLSSSYFSLKCSYTAQYHQERQINPKLTGNSLLASMFRALFEPHYLVLPSVGIPESAAVISRRASLAASKASKTDHT